VEAALRELDVFARENFGAALVSLKASSVRETIAANRLFAQRSDVPLHIGVTEAGPLVTGLVRSAAALYTLLLEGIGDTVRVSLSDSAENEVIAAREIIAAVYECLPDADNRCKGRAGVRIVSCPRCGRCAFDTHAFTARWIGRLYALEKEATVAIMGCAVNGPGEARHADLGITGAGGKVLIFKRGAIVQTIDKEDAAEVCACERESL
jgi:(E)-4-hydroxy-3-methylbut-2-enyl-diphosphate synthase